MTGESSNPTTGHPRVTRASSPLPSPVGYVLWTLVGGLFSFGIMSILTIGPWAIIASVVLTIIGLADPSLRNRSVLMLISGIGIPVLYVAWLNRDGPGTVCRTDGASTLCGDEWSPWPFMAVALLLMGAGVALSLMLRRRSGCRCMGAYEWPFSSRGIGNVLTSGYAHLRYPSIVWRGWRSVVFSMMDALCGDHLSVGSDRRRFSVGIRCGFVRGVWG